jgi:hypothetical protein
VSFGSNDFSAFSTDDDYDDDDVDRQKRVDELKERLVENPFDEHFRKAAQGSML